MGSPVSDDKSLGGNKDFDIEDEPSEFDGDGFDGKPFDDEPFDAGVEADEEESPEKFIQQLSGKLGQSLRKYTEDSGEPNFDLEKFAINSVISATNTSKMDQQDQSDIIAKVKSSSTNKTQNNDNELNDMGDSPNDEDSETDFSDEGGFDLSNIDVEESHNPNGNKKTVFKNQSLGVKNGGMEENKYLKLENSNKINTYPEKWLEKIIKSVIQETFYEPITKPKVQPIVKPIERPSRRKKPYTIIPEQLPNPKPKAEKKKVM